MPLVAEGTTSINDVVQAVQVSRGTIYMLFPTAEQLLLDATLGALSIKTVDPVIDGSDEVMTRIELSRTGE